MAFELLITQAGILVAGALSPGPNNTLALGAAMRNGLSGALRVAFGVVGGGLVMLVAVAMGLGAVLADHPATTKWATWLGAAYLTVLGSRMMFRAAPWQLSAQPVASAGEAFLLQFVNPKAWTLMIALVAIGPAHGRQSASIAILAMLFATVSFSCLFLWSLAGSWLAGWRGFERHARRVDQVLGGLLIACAVSMVVPHAS